MNPLDFSVLWRGDYPALIARGMVTLLELTAASWVLAMALGTLLAFIRMSRSRIARAFVATYVEYHQNVPMLVQIFLWYFGIPTLLPQDWQMWVNRNGGEFIFAFIAIGLAMAAYVSEALRGGIRAVPGNPARGRARPRALNFLQSFQPGRPAAGRCASRCPRWSATRCCCFKNTSLAMAIGVAELTYATREIESQTFRTVEVYLLATAVYLALTLAHHVLPAARAERAHCACPRAESAQGHAATSSPSSATTACCCWSGSTPTGHVGGLVITLALSIRRRSRWPSRWAMLMALAPHQPVRGGAPGRPSRSWCTSCAACRSSCSSSGCTTSCRCSPGKAHQRIHDACSSRW
jgi:polar amino acid transport system permease protein